MVSATEPGSLLLEAEFILIETPHTNKMPAVSLSGRQDTIFWLEGGDNQARMVRVERGQGQEGNRRRRTGLCGPLPSRALPGEKASSSQQ